MAHVLKYGFSFSSWGRICVDKKYTKERDQFELERTLEKVIGTNVVSGGKVHFVSGEAEPGLGLADFVAGAFYVAYNHGDCQLVELIESKVVVEEKILWREIKREATAPKGSVGPA